jgi:hypothetical protein
MSINPLETIAADVSLFRAKSFVEQMTEINQPYTAKSLFNELMARIQRFESELNQEYEVGMKLVSFGQATQFSVSHLGYTDPSIIWFAGVLSDGSSVELIQHVSQISFLLLAIQRPHPEKPKPQIGFLLPV